MYDPPPSPLVSGFGPELAAIIEDDAPTETRWRYFLRYFQGKVNQEDIADYDEEDEGFRYDADVDDE